MVCFTDLCWLTESIFTFHVHLLTQTWYQRVAFIGRFNWETDVGEEKKKKSVKGKNRKFWVFPTVLKNLVLVFEASYESIKGVCGSALLDFRSPPELLWEQVNNCHEAKLEEWRTQRGLISQQPLSLTCSAEFTDIKTSRGCLFRTKSQKRNSFKMTDKVSLHSFFRVFILYLWFFQTRIVWQS